MVPKPIKKLFQNLKSATTTTNKRSTTNSAGGNNNNSSNNNINGMSSTDSAFFLQAVQRRILEEETNGWENMELDFDDITERGEEETQPQQADDSDKASQK